MTKSSYSDGEIEQHLLDLNKKIPVLSLGARPRTHFYDTTNHEYWYSEPKYNKYCGESGILVPTITDTELERYLSPSFFRRMACGFRLFREGSRRDTHVDFYDRSGDGSGIVLASGPGGQMQYRIVLNTHRYTHNVLLAGKIKIDRHAIFPRVVRSSQIGLFESGEKYKRRKEGDRNAQKSIDDMYEYPKNLFRSSFSNMELVLEMFKKGLEKLKLSLSIEREEPDNWHNHEENKPLANYIVGEGGIGAEVFNPIRSYIFLRARKKLQIGTEPEVARKVIADMGKIISVGYHLSENLESIGEAYEHRRHFHVGII